MPGKIGRGRGTYVCISLCMCVHVCVRTLFYVRVSRIMIMMLILTVVISCVSVCVVL